MCHCSNRVYVGGNLSDLIKTLTTYSYGSILFYYIFWRIYELIRGSLQLTRGLVQIQVVISIIMICFLSYVHDLILLILRCLFLFLCPSFSLYFFAEIPLDQALDCDKRLIGPLIWRISNAQKFWMKYGHLALLYLLIIHQLYC